MVGFCLWYDKNSPKSGPIRTKDVARTFNTMGRICKPRMKCCFPHDAIKFYTALWAAFSLFATKIVPWSFSTFCEPLVKSRKPFETSFRLGVTPLEHYRLKRGKFLTLPRLILTFHKLRFHFAAKSGRIFQSQPCLGASMKLYPQ